MLIGELSLSTANLNPDGAYVGLGFGDSPRMADKDMIIASIDGSGSCSVDAYYSTSQSAPSPQSMASTLMTGSQCMMADGVMTVRFAKTMDASSSPSMLDKDLSPTDSSLQVVYAYAGTPLTYHGPNRGANGLPLAQGALLADVVSAPGEGPSHSPTTSTTTTSPSSGYGASLGLGVLLATLCSLVAK